MEAKVLRLWETDERFLEIYEKIKYNTVMPAEKLYVIYTAALATKVRGKAAELGVYKGGTARLILEAYRPDFIYLYDTFNGMPEGDAGVDWHKKGDFNDVSLEGVKNYLADYEKQAIFYPGIFPVTAEYCRDGFGFVHLDGDLYETTLEGLKYFYKRMLPRGIIVLDDYGWSLCEGVKKACDEFLKGIDNRVIPLPTGQGLLII